MVENDEMLELVSDDGTVTGQMKRSEVYAKGLKSFRLADVFLKNPVGKIFLGHRSRQKTIGPNTWATVTEHVHPGEKDIDSARRALLEETALDVPASQFQFLGYTTPREGGYGHIAAFLVETDRVPMLSNEHSEGKWMTQGEIAQLLREDQGQFLTNTRLQLAKYANQLF